MSDFDAIVIGTGNAGLTAATTLQRGGVRTLLLERHNIPGGCATSFVRGEFEFEVALHQLSGMGTEAQPFVMRKVFSDLGIMDKLSVVDEKELYRIVMPGEFDVTLPADWEALKTTLCERFPAEEKSLLEYLNLCEVLAFESFMSLPNALKSGDQAVLEKTCPNYVKYGLRSAKDVLDEFFDDADLKSVLAAYWCYLGMPPKDIPFSDLSLMLYAYAAFKPCHIKGGSQAISSAMLESFLEAGGEVRFNCGAEKIITEAGKVAAVVTEAGERFSCKAVISNTSPIHTFNELLDIPTPEQAAQDMKSRRLGTSAFVLYLGLDCSPEDIGVTAASSFIIDDRNEEVAFDTMQGISDPTHTMLTCYNHEDPSFAPEGKTVLSLLCLQYGQPWQELPPEQYAETKYAFADKLIDHAERIFPNIRANIEEVEVGTPLTMMRYLNTPGGAIYGFEQNTQDSAMFRERIDAIGGLYMAGCWNGMGGFQPTYMAGASTAKAAIKHLQAQQQEVSHA
ncbi:NAD(P)/FAD-dependent oxidoreductase [Aestuariirhabdus sp. Z084]|uniref:phytoene desaturase family protein n=1 Tax=Aestuariirhabdus haliotis TaxID=2918751 RepID=UPI00201B3B69|nr:NAD(P)/FAD-dependent oxidoreductase [Aestuariirhabdus haliotis]MCL6417752.1 NAD(P)/FAD-dependent oxidoreductase [Aestuariirhabdus haliotis]MCL6421691.1 NAD(P)/FAD-dependent oxidoreductase [Aestuariirhabdus haliotis]